MKDFSATVSIQAPPERVWRVMTDVERWPEWTPTVTTVRRTNSGPFRIGARARITQPRLPAAEWTVTALDDTRGFEWVRRSPGLRITARHSVEPNDTGSRVTLTVQFEGAFGGLIGRLTGGWTRRYLALEADGLKRRSEANHGPF